jgi:hypothetical protein
MIQTSWISGLTFRLADEGLLKRTTTDGRVGRRKETAIDP